MLVSDPLSLGDFQAPTADRPPHAEWAKAECWVGPDGGELSTGVVSEPIDLATDWDGVLRGFGLDPSVFEIVGDTVRMSKWQQSKRLENGDRDTIWLYSYRALFRRRPPRIGDADLDALRSRVAKWRPTPLPAKNENVPPCTFVAGGADPVGTSRALPSSTWVTRQRVAEETTTRSCLASN